MNYSKKRGIEMLKKHDMIKIVRSQLATDLNCSPDDFDRDGFVFCEARENQGRRPFPRGERHFEMYTMGKAIIVSATQNILPYIREQLDGKTSYDAFDMPFILGQGICFLPDKIAKLSVPDNIETTFVEQLDIPKLYSLKGFKNAIMYDKNHPRPDVLTITAEIGSKIIGIAGCSADCEMMWQIGIDVLPEHREKGLATALTAMLADEIIQRGKIPYYATATSNIASQRVAARAGFMPAWMCVYRGIFDGVLTQPTS
jgi:GNAT superfamily N-acetyltransferase